MNMNYVSRLYEIRRVEVQRQVGIELGEIQVTKGGRPDPQGSDQGFWQPSH
jgi:hypothetical protein